MNEEQYKLSKLIIKEVKLNQLKSFFIKSYSNYSSLTSTLEPQEKETKKAILAKELGESSFELFEKCFEEQGSRSDFSAEFEKFKAIKGKPVKKIKYLEKLT